MVFAFNNDRRSGEALDGLKNLIWACVYKAQFSEGLVHPLGVPEFGDLPVDDEFADWLGDRGEPDFVAKDFQRQIVRDERCCQCRGNRVRPSATQFHDDAGRARRREGFRVRREGSSAIVVRKSASGRQN
jgi:hypothetical protein